MSGYYARISGEYLEAKLARRRDKGTLQYLNSHDTVKNRRIRFSLFESSVMTQSRI